MYLILLGQDDPLNQRGAPPGCFTSYFTDDAEKASKCLKTGSRVFKLDSLTEIVDIELSYQEVTKETQNV